MKARQHNLAASAHCRRTYVPCDNLVPHLVEAGRNLCNIDILAPGLLALAALLLVLRGRCLGHGCCE